MSIAQLEAFQTHKCCECEKDLEPMSRSEIHIYKRTALCDKCWRESISTKGAKLDTNGQQSLPLVGDAPMIITLAPLSFGQIVLYRSDLLAECMIRVDRKSAIGLCNFTIIAPSSDTTDRIAKYLRGDNDA